MAVIAVLASIASLFASSSPTGIGEFDVLYRVGFAVAVTLAASRARRWALITSSAVVSASALGPALLIGVVALALAVALVGGDRRDRVYGATVGALVSVAAMHLSIDIAFGASAISGAVAAGLLIASGYRNTSSRVRRWWRAAVLGLVAVELLGIVTAGLATATASRPLLDGVDAAQQGVRSLQDADRNTALVSLDRGASLLQSATDRSGAWWAKLGRVVPVMSQNLEVVQAVAHSGAVLTRAAGDITATVDYDALRLPTGGIDLRALESFQRPLAEALRALGTAKADLDSLRSPWHVSSLRTRLDEFRHKVDQLHRQTAIASLTVDTAPGMLGATGERRYLVLLGDPAEARDLGGHLGNWAEIDAIGGRLHLRAVGLPDELRLDSDPNPALLSSLESYPPSLTEMKPLTFPQNWGSSPDMAEVARLSAELYRRRTGRTVNGVLYADPTAFGDFLAITGPIPMPSLGRTLSRADAVQFLTSGQFTEVPRGSTADAAVTQLVRDMFDRLTTARLPGPKELSGLFRESVLQGRLKLFSFEVADQPLLTALNIDGALSLPAHGDVLGIINRNANPSKIDTYLFRSTSADVRWNPVTGEVNEQVTVTLRNDAPSGGLPALVIGNRADLPLGTNLTDLALLTRYELTEVTIDNQLVASRPLYDGRYWRNTVRVVLPPGGTSIVRFRLQGSLEPSDRYSVFVVGQPLVNEGAVTLRVRPTVGTMADGSGFRVDRHGATVRLDDGHDVLIDLRVRR